MVCIVLSFTNIVTVEITIDYNDFVCYAELIDQCSKCLRLVAEYDEFKLSVFV